MDAIQAMMSALQQQSNQMMVQLATQQMEAFQAILQQSRRPEVVTDTRGIGRPINFKGDETKYSEWKAKLIAYFMVSIPDSQVWMSWAAESTTVIDSDRIDEKFETNSGQVKEFAVKLYATLLSCTEDDPFRIVYSVKDNNGLEALRLMMNVCCV